MDRIENFLNQRKQDGLFRVLKPAALRSEGRIHRDGKKLFDFSSNDYLALSSHPLLKEAAIKATEKFGTGSSASRLLSGDLHIHHELEEKTAAFKGKENALVFNSGYQANVGIISALYKAGDAVFSDKLNHASILDGISLSAARIFRFRHNDSDHLESLLKKQAAKFKNRLIVTESIFSMDGDRPPLKELILLKEKFGCEIMVDEAHATGIFGKNGSGVVDELGMVDKVDFIMGTFSKALGSFGAYIAASKKTIDYLINTSRSFIYSTALPPSVIAANIAALTLLKKEPFRRKTLLENAAYFRSRLTKKGLQIKGSSQIVPLIVGDSDTALRLSSLLREAGYWSLPIRPPTVQPGQSRLRFSLTYHHSKKLLHDLAEKIGELLNV
jgi:8-amino-7-oxononanoate synthase